MTDSPQGLYFNIKSRIRTGNFSKAIKILINYFDIREFDTVFGLQETIFYFVNLSYAIQTSFRISADGRSAASH